MIVAFSTFDAQFYLDEEIDLEDAQDEDVDMSSKIDLYMFYLRERKAQKS